MNVLFIMADQMATRAVGAYGNPVVKTPNIDALASRGALFDNFYCNSPLCVPSRASMMTGRLPNTIGSFDNGSELPASIPTFVHSLRFNNYRTILSGKMHFIGPDQLHGFEERLITDIYPAALDWTPDWSQGVKLNPGSSAAKLRKSGLAPYTVQMEYDDAVQNRTLQRLRQLKYESDKRPFFLCVSFTHPHDPFQITEKYYNRYSDGEIDTPLPSENPVHKFNSWINVHHGLDRFPPSEDAVRRSRRAYYGMASYVDDKVGGLLEELEDDRHDRIR